MFDIRYHITSLVAVFLALTVGLLLGSLIIDSSTLTRRQAKLMESINSDIKNIRQKNHQLNSQVRELEDFKSKVWQAAVKNRLSEQKILTISMSAHQDDIFQGIANALDKAGAKSAHLKIDISKLDFQNNDFIAQITPSLGTTVTTGTFENLFWQRLSQEISGREPINLITNLASRGILNIDDQSILPVDGVVLLDSKKSGKNNYDVNFLSALSGIPDLVVIGAETSDFKPSRMPLFQKQPISTIDNIESVPGWISLVYLFEQKATKANFGVKPTADKLMPD